MDYKYSKPKKLKLSEFVEEFVPNFDHIDEDSKMNFQSIEAWAGDYCVPPNNPYNPVSCIPIG